MNSRTRSHTNHDGTAYYHQTFPVGECPGCNQTNVDLVKHHWYQNDSPDKQTKLICQCCNSSLRGHLLPEWGVQRQWLIRSGSPRDAALLHILAMMEPADASRSWLEPIIHRAVNPGKRKEVK